MGNCDSCIGGREHPPQSQSTNSTPNPTTQPVKFKAERSASFFTVSSVSNHVNYRIIPADDPGLKVPLPLPLPEPKTRIKKPVGI